MVIAQDFLHNNFEMITTLLLHSSDKDLKKIQQIVTSTEVITLAKYVKSQTADLKIMIKNNQPDKKSRIKLNKECFHCDKKGYYTTQG